MLRSMVLSMEQKCGTNHPILQPRLKQLFKSVRKMRMARFTIIFAVTAMGAYSNATLAHNEVFSVVRSALISQNIVAQREKFEAAERRMRSVNAVEFEQLRHRFAGYPLWPYLEGEYLQRNLSMAREATVLDFLSQHYGSPPERQLRDAWLRYLGRRNDAERYVRDYVARGNIEQQCRYLGYRLDQNPTDVELAEDIWPQVTSRWTQATSQPRVCDRVFARWSDAGQRTQAIVWQRFDAALNAGVWNIARYARSLLSDSAEPGATELASQLMTLRQRPQRGLAQWSTLPANSERARHHLYAALQQISWADIDLMQSLWLQMRDEIPFSSNQRQVLDSQIGVVLAVRDEPQARIWFNSIDTTQLGPAGQHWYLATLLRSEDFKALLEFTQHMTEGAQRDYWQARALVELDRPMEAEAIWKSLSQQRHYYGFMAAAYLGQQPNLSREPVAALPTARLNVQGRPEMLRAREFYELGRFFDARREWNLVRARAPQEERIAAAVLAYEWGWYDQSIRELASLGLLQDLERRFPIGFAEDLQREASNQNIDASWAFAIIRRESAFQIDALSPVGARGLMQIMPATADYIQRTSSAGRPSQRAPNLNNPTENIRYGTYYLSELLNRNRGNWLLATASYNAGYHRVQEWIPAAPVPVDIWIETIPYQETRDYVKAVLTYQQIYVSLLGRDDNLLEHMHSMLMDPQGDLCDYAERDHSPIAVC